MCINKKSGFTLIELMVVIVIIGVLASLAIPRFTEASDKAKVAEAPRILASYESAYLAAVAEVGEGNIGSINDVVFDLPAVVAASKWFGYDVTDADEASAGLMTATPKSSIGKFGQTELITTYTIVNNVGSFVHSANGDQAIAKRYVPNFMP